MQLSRQGDECLQLVIYLRSALSASQNQAWACDMAQPHREHAWPQGLHVCAGLPQLVPSLGMCPTMTVQSASNLS